jgi:TonB family protein
MSNFSLNASRPRLRYVLGALCVLGCAVPALEARAQDKVYTSAELSSQPAVRSKDAAAAAIERSFPSGLRAVGGKVQLQFVVTPSGKVDPASIEVIAASVAALGDAAKKAVTQIEFTPGKVDGNAVPTRVIFPVVYAAR